MKIFRCVALVVVLGWLGATAHAQAAAAPSAAVSQPGPLDVLGYDDVRADMAELVSAIADLHPNPFWSRSRTQLEADAAALSELARGGTLKRRECFRELAKLIISLDDPHSWAFTPGWKDYLAAGGREMPLELQFRDGAATVKFAPPDSGIPKAASVTAINGLLMADLYKEFRPLTGQADDPFGDEFLATFFSRYLWFFHDWSGPFTVTVAVDGSSRDVVLPGLTSQELDAALGAADEEAPLALRMPQSGIAVLEFRRCAAPEKIRALAEPMFRRLKDEHVGTLIVDARDNAGGGDDAWRVLLEFLTSKPYSGYRGGSFRVSQRLKDMLGKEEMEMRFQTGVFDLAPGTVVAHTVEPGDLITPPDNPLRFDGKWAVLAGRRTFSSGMAFVSAVKGYDLAPVVGEETGGRVKGFGQWVRVKLPRTGLEVALSTKQFDGAVDVPLRRGVPPDVQVKCPASIPEGSENDPVVRAGIEAARAEGQK
ncbi:MAG: S41 family peptidase [Phycisphaerales bacterium]|jgi:hypothetical protein